MYQNWGFCLKINHLATLLKTREKFAPNSNLFANKVTRLGECPPIGWLFTMGSFSKNWRKFWTTFSQRTSSVFILTKNELGYTLGDCFKSLSGHPARQKPFVSLSRAIQGKLKPTVTFLTCESEIAGNIVPFASICEVIVK
jgi:hypothetical protein